MSYPKTMAEYRKQQEESRQTAGNTPAVSGGFSYLGTIAEYRKNEAQMRSQIQSQQIKAQTAERDRCLSASGWSQMETDMGTLFGTMDGYFQKRHRGVGNGDYKLRVTSMLQSVEKERDYFNRYAGVMGEDAQKYQNRLNEWETQLKRYRGALEGKETDEDSLALGSGLARFRTEANDYFTKASETEAGTAVANKAMQWASGAKKLLEEAAEYRQTPCMEEMADLMEVIEAICKARSFDPAALQAVKQEKAAKRGAFEKRIFLHAVAEPDELLDR